MNNVGTTNLPSECSFFKDFTTLPFNKRQIMQNPGTFIRKPRCCGKFDGEKPRRLNL